MKSRVFLCSVLSEVSSLSCFRVTCGRWESQPLKWLKEPHVSKTIRVHIIIAELYATQQSYSKTGLLHFAKRKGIKAESSLVIYFDEFLQKLTFIK